MKRLATNTLIHGPSEDCNTKAALAQCIIPAIREGIPIVTNLPIKAEELYSAINPKDGMSITKFTEWEAENLLQKILEQMPSPSLLVWEGVVQAYPATQWAKNRKHVEIIRGAMIAARRKGQKIVLLGSKGFDLDQQLCRLIDETWEVRDLRYMPEDNPIRRALKWGLLKFRRSVVLVRHGPTILYRIFQTDWTRNKSRFFDPC